MIRDEVLGQNLSANRPTGHAAQRRSIDGAAVDAKPNDATSELVHDNKTQWVLR
jgi:hypothetical protein